MAHHWKIRIFYILRKAFKNFLREGGGLQQSASTLPLPICELHHPPFLELNHPHPHTSWHYRHTPKKEAIQNTLKGVGFPGLCGLWSQVYIHFVLAASQSSNTCS